MYLGQHLKGVKGKIMYHYLIVSEGKEVAHLTAYQPILKDDLIAFVDGDNVEHTNKRVHNRIFSVEKGSGSNADMHTRQSSGDTNTNRANTPFARFLISHFLILLGWLIEF